MGIISFARMKIYISHPMYLGQGQGESRICVGEIQELMHTRVDEVPRAHNYILLQPLLQGVWGAFGVREEYLKPLQCPVPC